MAWLPEWFYDKALVTVRNKSHTVIPLSKCVTQQNILELRQQRCYDLNTSILSFDNIFNSIKANKSTPLFNEKLLEGIDRTVLKTITGMGNVVSNC